MSEALMPRPIPQILIADGPAAERTFAIVRDEQGLSIYEVLDEGEALGGTVLSLPGGNGDALLLETWGEQDNSAASLQADGERIAGALEEIGFRDDHRGYGDDDD